MVFMFVMDPLLYEFFYYELRTCMFTYNSVLLTFLLFQLSHIKTNNLTNLSIIKNYTHASIYIHINAD